MLTVLRSVVAKALHARGYSFIETSRLDTLLRYERDLERITSISDRTRHQIITALPKSRAQLKQDVFALSRSGFKQGGFFVEFGATDGVSLSNTDLLEKEFGWSGILAEPGRCWHQALRSNRRCCIDTACVWPESGAQLVFDEVIDRPEFSSIGQFRTASSIGASERVEQYEVDTLSLVDLLKKHEAPCTIDYLSIDTEGSEFDILQAFDFSEYCIETITVEHNFAPQRMLIYDLLTGKGYERLLTSLSRWDDWYVRRP